MTAPERRGFLPFTALAGAAALVLLGRAADLQLSRKSEEHARALAAERRHTTTLPAMRGRILDAQGTVLAEDRLEHDVMATPGALQVPERLAALARVLGLDERARAALEKRVHERAARHPWVPVVVARSVSDATADALRGPSRVVGASVTTAPRRRYPHGAAFASLVGHVGHVGRAPARAGLLAEDRVGRVGVEKAFDSRLRGTPGKRVAPASRFVRGEPTHVEEPRAGSDVTLTVDARLTQTAARGLRTAAIRSGAVVVLDPRDGALLASVSSPAIDPDKLARGTLDDAGDRPWVDRTRKLAHAPGSLVKPFYLLAALSHGHDGAHTCTGSMSFGKLRYRCTRAHGRVDVAHAVSSSCNVFFFETGAELGADALNDVLHRAGMLGPIGMPLGEPDGAFRSATPRSHRRIADTLNAAIGQGELRVSPLAVAVAYGALANGGRVLTPRVLATDETFERGTLPAREALSTIRVQLVARSRELGRDHEPLPRDVAATFGAARSLRDGMARDDHWFAAFAPADAPRVVVVVFGEESSQSTVANVGLGVLAAALGDGGDGDG